MEPHFYGPRPLLLSVGVEAHTFFGLSPVGPRIVIRCSSRQNVSLEIKQKRNAFLIVEDDPNDAFLIKRALGSGPCGHVSLCRNPSEAKAYLKGAGMYSDRKKYPWADVVITDLDLGDETGINLVEWIRQQEPPLRDTPVLILTGRATSTQWEAAQKVGAQKVYRKPSRLEEMEELLRTIVAEYCGES